MVENLAERIAAYGSALRYEDLPPEVVHRAKALLLDTLGCAVGAWETVPVKIALKIAGGVRPCEMPATILGSSRRSSPDLTTFANGVLIRTLDFNDGFAGRSGGGGHPSDNFAPILACADALRVSGKTVLVASVLAYEVVCRLADRVNLLALGVDYPVFGVISATVAAARIFGLSREQTVQAINLAVAPNVALRQTRVGEVSLWKGCAMANAARNAVFAVLLSREGMTGPSPVFEGRYGLFRSVTGPFDLDEFGGAGRPFRMMEATIKRYPCGQLSQTAIDAAIKLRSIIGGVGQIAAIEVDTFEEGRNTMAGDPEKWRPLTRESADHSLPYVVATALLYGSVELCHFDEEHRQRADLLALTQKITVKATDECIALYPGASANRVTVRLESGRTWTELVRVHRGHHLNPLSDEEVERKFHSLTGHLLQREKREAAAAAVWNLEKAGDVGHLIALVEVENP